MANVSKFFLSFEDKNLSGGLKDERYKRFVPFAIYYQNMFKTGTSFAFKRVMSEKQMQEWPKIHRRIVLMCGLIGMLAGLLIAIWNTDVFGWALLKVTGLGACFAWASDVVVKRLMKAWLESKLQELEKAAAAAALKHAQAHGAKA